MLYILVPFYVLISYLVLFEKRESVQVSPLVHLWSTLGPSGWHMPTMQLGASMGQMLAEGKTKARLNGHIQASLNTIQMFRWRYSLSLCVVLGGSCKPDISYWVCTLTCFNPWLLELLGSQRDVPFRPLEMHSYMWQWTQWSSVALSSRAEVEELARLSTV